MFGRRSSSPISISFSDLASVTSFTIQSSRSLSYLMWERPTLCDSHCSEPPAPCCESIPQAASFAIVRSPQRYFSRMLASRSNDASNTSR